MPKKNKYGKITSSEFSTATWLKNKHLQTLFLPIKSLLKNIKIERKIINLPDGDIISIDTIHKSKQQNKSKPLLLILHGLEGSSRSSYAMQLLQYAQKNDWNAAVINSRDCGGCHNKLPRRYHAGETSDLKFIVEKIHHEGYMGKIYAVGYSLGGNVLLKYLGEKGEDTFISAAVAISVPLDLHMSSLALNQNFSKIYQFYLLNCMKKAIRRKFNKFNSPFEWSDAMNAKTFSQFDNIVTAPLHGFNSKNDYYELCSSKYFLRKIKIPTLIINSRDDPFMLPEMIPDANNLSNSVQLEISDSGGHVGFISGGTPCKPKFYLPKRIFNFLSDYA